MIDPESSRPLKIELSEIAEAELADAYAWMQRFGFDIAEKWLQRLLATLENEASLLSIADLRRPIHPRSSTSHTFRTLLFRTGKRGSSPWRIVYEILTNEQPNILHVVSIKHASRR